MVLAKAPGKVVISGAYAVLEGAPAVVAAVDRYALADSTRPSQFLTAEVAAALGQEQAPWFDAEQLRSEGQKLGLGSSAAILVASLAARELELHPELSDGELADAVFDRALAAHRAAQGGGSGIDVAASAFGGVLIAQRVAEALQVRSVVLPRGLHLEIWSCAKPASTSALIARVHALRAGDPSGYARLMSAQAQASARAAAAIDSGDTEQLIHALAEQCDALGALGHAACAPIVTPELAELAVQARAMGAALLPSGAGGGDIALFAGRIPPSDSLRHAAQRCGITQLDLSLGARGVHAVQQA